MVFFLTINLIKYNSEFNSILWITRPYLEQLNWVMVFRLHKQTMGKCLTQGNTL